MRWTKNWQHTTTKKYNISWRKSQFYLKEPYVVACKLKKNKLYTARYFSTKKQAEKFIWRD